MKVYKSNDTLPIWNKYKIYETGDLRYLLKDIDYDELPQIETDIKNLLIEAQRNIIETSTNIDFSLQQSYYYSVEAANVYVYDKTAKNEQIANETFNNYLKELDNNFFNYKINNETFKTSVEAYQYIKNNANLKNSDEWRYFIFTRVVLLSYNTIVAESLRKWHFYEEIAGLSKLLGFNIDERNTSVTKYNSYKEISEKILKNG